MIKSDLTKYPGYSSGLRLFADAFKNLGTKYDFQGFKVLTRSMASSIEEDADFWESRSR